MIASLLSLLLLLQSVLAAFTRKESDCWRRDCVVRTDAGTFCFVPQDSGIAHEECADSSLKNLTRVHLTSTVGRSIAYYDDNFRMFGAATWPIPHDMPTGSVYVCMTGRQLDNPAQYFTVCRTAHGDDDMSNPAAHVRECVSHQKPKRVSDGCFTLGKPPGGEDDRKEWYEQPVVAGLFYLLGALVTLERVCFWIDHAARMVVARLPRLIPIFTVAFERFARHWRRVVVPFPMPMHQPAAIA